MDFDDDAPPDLVQTDKAAPDTHEVTVKVPITIVTGKTKVGIHDATRRLIMRKRVFGGWKNNSIELYLDGPTWQEDRSYNEWFVIQVGPVSYTPC